MNTHGTPVALVVLLKLSPSLLRSELLSLQFTKSRARYDCCMPCQGLLLGHSVDQDGQIVAAHGNCRTGTMAASPPLIHSAGSRGRTMPLADRNPWHTAHGKRTWRVEASGTMRVQS
jgi:hypothetical protein